MYAESECKVLRGVNIRAREIRFGGIPQTSISRRAVLRMASLVTAQFHVSIDLGSISEYAPKTDKVKIGENVVGWRVTSTATAAARGGYVAV